MTKVPLSRVLGRGAKKVLPRAIVRLVQRITGRPAHQVRPDQYALGDLRRLAPISHSFGFDRGTPIDRHYIECFLNRNADISHCNGTKNKLRGSAVPNTR